MHVSQVWCDGKSFDCTILFFFWESKHSHLNKTLVLSVWRTALLAQRKHRRSRALPEDRVTVDQQQWSCNKMSAFFSHTVCVLRSGTDRGKYNSERKRKDLCLTWQRGRGVQEVKNPGNKWVVVKVFLEFFDWSGGSILFLPESSRRCNSFALV
jgi:hypothetical protein